MDVIKNNKSNMVKIALFYSASDWVWDPELPEGCPEEYAEPEFENRKALAEWFLSDGMKYFRNEKDGILFFFYCGDYGIHYHIVAVIDLDISRPWKFKYSDDDEWPWERVWYLDVKDEDNRIYPAIYPHE